MQITARRLTSSLMCPQSRKEIFEASNLTFHSNNQWCWCSSSAAVCSDSFTPQQRGKKLTKQERSVLVLAFVEKYMASSGGKFPTITSARKQVGGSYYSIRSIIQELEYHHKRASLETKKEVKVREENDKSEVFPLTAESRILTDANHKTASSKTKKEDEIKEENGNSEVFPLTVEACTSADTDQRTASLGIKKEVKISEEIDKYEDFPSTAEPRILVDTKQEDATKIRKKCPSNKSKIDTKTFRSSIEVHSDNQIEINTHKQLSPSKISEDILGFDNLHSSSQSAMETAENPISAEFKTETIIFRSPTKEGDVLENDAASAANLQGEYCPQENKMSNQEELYHDRRERAEQQTVAATNGLSFWGNLKSMAFGIINLWKK